MPRRARASSYAVFIFNLEFSCFSFQLFAIYTPPMISFVRPRRRNSLTSFLERGPESVGSLFSRRVFLSKPYPVAASENERTRLRKTS